MSHRLPAPRVCVATLLTALALAGCAEVGDGEQQACASVMSYAEPVLTLRAVIGPEGRDVEAVTLGAITLDGRPLGRELRDQVGSEPPHRPGTLTNGTPYAGLTLAADGSLTCAVPCGFGNDPGLVEMTVVSPEGDRGRVRARVDYDTALSTCGGGSDDGTDLRVRLRERTGS